MKDGIKILIVEDEFITQKVISDALLELGYRISGDALDADEAIKLLDKKQTDLAILDIQIQGEKDGIWIAKQIRTKYDIPFIFLTANADKETVRRATETEPNGYLVKPFNKEEIYAAIETALRNFSKRPDSKSSMEEDNLVVSDSIFIKENQVYKKVKFNEIIYIKSEGHYLEIHSKIKRYVIRGSLKDFIDVPGINHFLQVHRSYIINLSEIESFGGDFITINKAQIPLAQSFKEDFLKKVKTM